MKITSKGRYAVLAMVDIARHSNNSPCKLTDVSIRQNISLAYLERIFNELSRYFFLSPRFDPMLIIFLFINLIFR